MTTFVHVDQPASHAGVVRAEAVFDRLSAIRQRVGGVSGPVVVLLGIVFSTLLVVADRLVANLGNDGLLLGWVVLCGMLLVAVALLIDTARGFAQRAVAQWQRGVERRRAARADAEFLLSAQRHPRVMLELQAAQQRAAGRN